jgi:secondary thiamine-phosphate synthase enzyme
MVHQVEITLSTYPRGFHLVTGEIVAKLPGLPQKGLVHLLLKHTSAGITINENADPTVRMDFESFFRRLVPENVSYFKHTLEGEDDMPAHLKASIVGQELTIPVSNGRLNLGTWQGIYLCEFRNHGGSRKILVTVISDN